MSQYEKELLLDYMAPPKENREAVWQIVLKLKELAPELVAKWLIDAKEAGL